MTKKVSPALRTIRSKILSPEMIKKKLRRRSSPVVFTNGCFDILHKGHVNYLQKASTLGTLVVALNGDASVRRLKGKSRPINSLSDRADVIAALESVDFVTWFHTDTPLKLIQDLKPDVLVKGGDWKVDTIVGAKEVLARGGKVRSIRFVQGRSTTAILKKAQAKA